LTPALLVPVISNGFQEEFLFRGLFLQRYNALFGAYMSNILQALVFAFAHPEVTYTPNALAGLRAPAQPATGQRAQRAG
jgi:membrane protease YdiL (CAAX protease family)